ncbi:MAG: PaaI family thioesterase [Spirochaetaceae bacterium]
MEKKRVVNKQNNSSYCLVCGLKNSFGLFTRFYETEEKELVGLATGRDEHQGYPGRMHGGIITALLDETVGRTVMIHDPKTFGVTAEISVRFKKPVPLEEELKIVGRIDRDNGRVFHGSGELVLQDGTVAATATGKFFKMHIDAIVEEGESFEEEHWFLEEGEDDPEVV